MDDNVFYVQINSKEEIRYYMATYCYLNLQIGFKVSQSLSMEEYRDVQTELMAQNQENERADFIANFRSSSCEPLPRITIRTVEDFRAEMQQRGNNFSVVIPPDVATNVRRSIMITARLNEVSVV